MSHPKALERTAVALVVGLAAIALIAGAPRTLAAPYTAGGYTTEAGVTPATVAPGGTTTVALQVTSAAAGTALVDVEVVGAAGKVFQRYFDAQSFTAGQARTYSVPWATTTATAPGSYTVKVGVFAPGWTSLRHWNNAAATINVSAATASPTPGPSATPPPTATPGPSGGLPALPAGWPSNVLQLGMSDEPGGAAALKGIAPFGFRSKYLAGGVNTGNGWATWNSDGRFVTYYIQDSVAQGITPVFSYYMIYQSQPGVGQSESSGVLTNLQNAATMTAYFNDLKLFFQRAGAFPNNPVVLHVEPDMWGFIQQRASNDNAATVSVQVAATGLSELSGLPNNAAGLAQGIVRLRDSYARNVLLGYHVSVWGTGIDIAYSDPSDASVDALGTRAGTYYRSLGANFDLAFAEFSDRDAAFHQLVNGRSGAWWDAEDYRRNVRFLGRFVSVAQERVVMWQIPFGNTKMRAMNNTWNHYQDNRVEWLLDEPARSHLAAYRDAGVIAFVFGRGADGATCACDANDDGVTNPAPINGNTRDSLSADDDGGFFKDRARAYYNQAAMTLSGGTPAPSPTPSPTAPPSPSPSPTTAPTATPSPTPTTTTAPQPGLTTTASASPSSVRAGAQTTITVQVTSTTSRSALVDVEVYAPNGTRVFQRYYDNQSFVGGVGRAFSVPWTPAATAAAGAYTVKVGVFSPGWGTLLHWNNGAATVTVAP
jgi:hypothetical protein